MSMNIAAEHHYATPRASRPVWATIASMLNISRQRAALRRLDQAGLADVGLDRHTAIAEANRPIWDVPANWRE